mgnify:CR=1 FL=1
MKKETKLTGYGIVVIPNGWIYVGSITIEKDWCIIDKAINIRRWGTSNGLGELAEKGPLENTKLDFYGVVRIPKKQIITIIDTDKELWKKD